MGIIKRLAWRFVLLGLCLALGLAGPGWAAERIYFDFSILGRSLAVTELANFAETGRPTGRLGYYLNWFTSPAQQQQLQVALQTRYRVAPLVVERFSYTSSGVRLLGEIGEIIQTEARLNGGQAIRSAAILAAAQPEGISVLSFLQQFPTDLRIDLQRLLRLIQRVQGILQQTETTVAQLHQQAVHLAADSTFPAAPDLRQSGPFTYQKRTLQILDPARQRQFAADLYLPTRPGGAEWPNLAAGSTPVVIMSNGLGAGRDRFDEIALHLVSHGFAIAIPDHPGSDRQRLREFYAGQHRENFEAREYIDRPQDITVLLNELERLNQTELGQRLNLERVGMFGYSFGGSTALSLAGATLN
ncbi:MAG: alpha/beta hydrolase, partial [Elainella sp.]